MKRLLLVSAFAALAYAGGGATPTAAIPSTICKPCCSRR